MYDEHFQTMLHLIEMERNAEHDENIRELVKLPLAVREAMGKTVTRLRFLDEDVGVGGIPLIRLGRDGIVNGLSPFHAMGQGDNVRMTFPSESGLGFVDGTLYDVDEFEATVAINGHVPDPFPSGTCQLDMLGSDATYRRMRQALQLVKRSEKKDVRRLREILIGGAQPEQEQWPPEEFYNSGLNEFQKKAVVKSMEATPVSIIHGPPGTGKTTVLVEIILQAVKMGDRVLASAPSNIAVDNLVEKLLPYKLRLVRLGHPARIMDSLRHTTLSAQVLEHPLQREIRKLDADRHILQKQLKRKEERGEGLDYFSKKELRREAERLYRVARNLEYGLRREITDSSQVVLATHGGINRDAGRGKFDLVVMDEASQATEPLSWVPIHHGRRVVFAGDHCQLPPTIYSKKAADGGLGTTLFDRLIKSLHDEFKSLLRIQYRMNNTIMKFSSDMFYEGKLIADPSVAEHLALPLASPNTKESLLEKPVWFIDTAGTGFDENWNDLLESRENEGEAKLVQKVVDRLINAGIKREQVAILSPYVAQVKKIRVLLGRGPIEIGSVDSFQGREKEVVIVSLVRSNDRGEVGFLSDTRRMNVALTRARRLLIVIGDSATISQHPFYRKYLDYIEEIGAHQSAWEWS